MPHLPHLTAPTLADQAYAAIREGITTGTFARGERVTERGLADALNISPTPVREALRRLEQDRLVERTGARSVQVAEFGEEQLREVTMIEDVLRALAARLAAQKATSVQLAEMKSALDEAETLAADVDTSGSMSSTDTALVAEILAAMRRFHAAIDRASSSPTLIHMLQMVDAFDSAERRVSVLVELHVDGATVKDRFHEHRAIYDAIAGRHPERAEALVRAHSASGSRSRLVIHPPDQTN